MPPIVIDARTMTKHAVSKHGSGLWQIWNHISVAMCFAGGLLFTAPPQFGHAVFGQSAEFTVLTYNIHHAEGVDGRLDLERIAGVIRDCEADIVALQEVDRNVPRSGNVDQPHQLADLLDMHVAFGGNIELQGGEYGNAVLSRFPIQSATNHLLPNVNGGEQRGMLQVEIELPNGAGGLTLLATHFDHRSDPAQRIASAHFINHLIATNDMRHPLVLAGDLNAVPSSSVLAALQSHWVRPAQEFLTIPVSQPSRQIDYVLTARAVAPSSATLSEIKTRVLDEAVASDHRGLVSHLKLAGTNSKLPLPISRVVFGSCIQQDQATPIFDAMLRENADLLLFLGDNIYADTDDLQQLRKAYATLKAKPDFQKLLQATPRIMATWDDHDYGVNDGGAAFGFREVSQTEFLDFWNEPKNSPRRNSPGVYEARIFGPLGKRLQVLLLDTRYFRSPLKKGARRVGGNYVPDEDPQKTMLGDAQWTWLAAQLRHPAEVRLLVSSIQCLPSDAGQETWSNLPLERQRLLQLIQQTQSQHMVILSGDRHWSELSAVEGITPGPLYELTSSSLNQIHERGTPTENLYRRQPKTFHEPNYGLIQVDWSSQPPKLALQIRDQMGEVQIEQIVPADPQ